MDYAKKYINFTYIDFNDVLNTDKILNNTKGIYDLICTQNISAININSCWNDYIFVNNVIMTLTYLKIGGNAIFSINITNIINIPNKQIIELLTMCFDKVIIYQSELISQSNNIILFILCHNYQQNSSTIIDTIDTMHNLYAKGNKKELLNILKIDIVNNDVYDTLIDLIDRNKKFYISDIDRIYKTSKNDKHIFEYRYNKQLKACIDWCSANDIEINPKYIKNNINFMDNIINQLYSFEPIAIEYFVNSKMNIPAFKIHDAPIDMILDKLKKSLDTYTVTMESRQTDKWNYVNNQIDMYKNLSKYLNIKYNVGSKYHRPSNAFCKMYEILKIFDLVPTSASNSIKTFHICEAPGNFIFAFNHYIFTKTQIQNYDWYMNSLNPYNEEIKKLYPEVFKDEYGLMKKYKNRLMFGNDDTGDITKISNLEDFYNKLGRVDIITGDCGLAIDYSLSNLQENILAKINFSQVLIVLTLLKNGGSFAIKHFLPMSLPIIISYMYLLYNCFDELYLTKPITSRPSNREIYIVGKGYHKLSGEYVAELLNFLNEFDPNKSLYKQTDIDENFKRQYYKAIDNLITKQIISINRSFYFYDDDNIFDNYKDKLNELKEMKNKAWVKHYKIEPIINEYKL
jgi:23S rRNA U2552 (ribose-2'-O)-methylase RlmE/FtsJ